MPAVHHGITTTEIYPQPGFSATSGSTGSVTGTGVYAVHKDFLSNPVLVARFKKGTPLADLDPDPAKGVYSFLQVNNASVAYSEGDLIFISVNFVGATNAASVAESNDLTPESEAFVEYSLDLDTIELPLHEHPKWVALGGAEKAFLGQLMQGIFIYDIANNKLLIPTDDTKQAELQAEDVTFADDAVQFATLIQQGKVTFDSPSVRWNATIDGLVAPLQLAALGKIDVPLGTQSPGFPAGLAGRNWKFLGGTQTETGEVARSTFSWLLSPTEAGFNAFLYTLDSAE